MKRRIIIGFILIALPALLMAEIAGPQQILSPFSHRLTPALDVPLGPSSAVFRAAEGMRFGADYKFPFLPMVYFSGGLGYDYVMAKGGVAPPASVTSLSLGSGLRFDLLPRLSATVGVSGGYFLSFLVTKDRAGQVVRQSHEKVRKFMIWRTPLSGGSGLRNTSNDRRTYNMPLFLDIHQHVPGLTADAVAGAHAKDLETQARYGVRYLKYWFDEGTGKVFCLVEAPNKEAAASVHREAHGLVADEIVEVKEGA